MAAFKFFEKVKSIFKKEEKNEDILSNIKCDDEKLEKFFDIDKYISKKELKCFLKCINDYQNVINIYNSDMLEEYCKKNKIDYNQCLALCKKISNIENLVNKHNDDYVQKHLISEKSYLDNIFSKLDPNIKLDDEQRNVVLRDEDYTLVVAGAGAGKTTTIAAKVKYLVDIKKVNPEEILIISYTNKAVDELEERINKKLNIGCKIATFHSAGFEIINKNNHSKFRIVNDKFIHNCVTKFLNELFKINESLLLKVILFFSYYLDFDKNVTSIEDIKRDREFNNYITLKSQVDEANQKEIHNREKYKLTIQYEKVKSFEEVKIANFLYINGIEYEYEKPYPHHIPGKRTPYLPDFTIFANDKIYYLEHFGITEDHKHSCYDEENLKKYVRDIERKKQLHKDKKTSLIYTYSSYNDGRSCLDHLQEILENNNIKMNPRTSREIYEQLSKTKDNRSIQRLSKLLASFINNYKNNGWDDSNFSTLYNNTKSERDKIFLEIAEQAYLFYQRELKEKQLCDFQDLINDSKKILDEVQEMKEKLPFKYIIIDEYQDISLQRFNLAKKLSEVTDAKIMAVGDDWQSIYAFAGSKIKLFTDFKEIFGYADLLEITHTYRNSQELIDIAGGFIQKNKFQIKKQLKSPKHLEYPVAIFTYSDAEKYNKIKGKKGVLEEKAEALEYVLDVIVQRNQKKNLEVLLIGRFGFDASSFGRTSLFYYDEENKVLSSKKYPNLKLEFLTAHSSKGLGKDEVIIINAERGDFGFPTAKTMDPVLNMVIFDDKSYEDAEERRLFYVALTRTKNRVYIISPKYAPSKFVLELKDEKNVYTDTSFKDVVIENDARLGNYCPHCGFPIYYKENKAFGKKMYVCSNDSEVCGFVSNNMKGGKTSIKKCPHCRDGYLFIKKMKNKEVYFLGCSNYDNKKAKCEYSESLDYQN